MDQESNLQTKFNLIHFSQLKFYYNKIVELSSILWWRKCLHMDDKTRVFNNIFCKRLQMVK